MRNQGILIFSVFLLSGCASNVAISSSRSSSPAPTATITASPAQVQITKSFTLEWQTTNAPEVTIDPIGPMAASGSISQSPAKTTTYKMTAIGLGGTATAGVTVIVLPNVACWGDSLTSGDGGFGTSYPGTLAQLSGMNVYNGGIGGQTSTQIAGRMLADSSKYDDVTVIWAGTNNTRDKTQILTDITSMVDALNSPKRFLILSLENGTFPSESQGYSQILGVDAVLLSAYPNNYLDVRKLLITDGLSFENLTPTAQDQQDISNDIIPTSLRNDSVHLNKYGYDFVGHKVHDWLKAHSMEQVN
jgi:lysophospholipase L1-like esterase